MPIPTPDEEDTNSFIRNARFRRPLFTFSQSDALPYDPFIPSPFTSSLDNTDDLVRRENERRVDSHLLRVRRAAQRRGGVDLFEGTTVEDDSLEEPADEDETGDDVLGDLLGYAAFSRRVSARPSATASTSAIADLDGNGDPTNDPSSRRGGASLFVNDDDVADVSGNSATTTNPYGHPMSLPPASPFASEQISSLLFGALNTVLSYRRSSTVPFPALPPDPSSSAPLTVAPTSRRSMSSIRSFEHEGNNENDPEEEDGMDFETMLRLLSESIERRTHGNTDERGHEDDVGENFEDEDPAVGLRNSQRRMWGWEADFDDDDEDTGDDEEDEDEDEDQDEGEDGELDDRALDDSDSDSDSMDSYPHDAASSPRSPIPQFRARPNLFASQTPPNRRTQLHPDSTPLMTAPYRTRFFGPPPDPNGERQESHARLHQHLAQHHNSHTQDDRRVLRHRGVLLDPDGVRVFGEGAADDEGTFWSRFKGRSGTGAARWGSRDGQEGGDDAYEEDDVVHADRRDEFLRRRRIAGGLRAGWAGIEATGSTPDRAGRQVAGSEGALVGR